ncbi:glycosyltransferase family 9 protein [Glaesserella sp.]|uniref:glycosyltransferase family 9 protein n=1 Tax=Glaesserella sp. TaxID=2094731 RepID=UPI0035A0E536
MKRFKKRLQTLRLRIGKYFIDIDNGKMENLPALPHKVLFLRHDGKIGDYIVSSFVFREIKKADPNIQIGVVCSHKNIDLFKQNPHIDKFYLVKPKSLSSYIKTGKAISTEKYDVVIDPTILLRNKDLILLRSIKAVNYVGYQKSQYKIFNLNIEGELHFRDVYRIALEKCGFENIDTRYDIPSQTESVVNVGHFLVENHLDNFVAVNFFGAANSRKFHRENIQAFLSYVNQHYPHKQFVLLTYPEVTPLLAELSTQFHNVFLYAQTTSIYDSIELIKKAEWVISPDTAIVHIASGFNKKIIGLYQDNLENWINWKPTTENECHIIRFKQNINEINSDFLGEIWNSKA